MAQFDVDQFESLGAERPYTVALQNEEGTAEPLTRLKLYKTGGKAPLSDLLPVLEALGLTVVEEVPTRLQEHEGSGRYLHDFGVLGANGWPLDLDRVGELVADTVRAVWDGRAESDSLNRLVPAAALTWRQVAMLRAYRQYRQLLGGGFTKRYVNDAFVRNWELAAQLVALFEHRLDPSRDGDAASERLEAEIVARLDEISSLDDDRILRSFLGMILATVRTNVFKHEGTLPYMSFKLRCEDVPGMPKPVPRWEIFVYSTEMEGVHLRGGFVARGGIRWSRPAGGLPHRDPGADEGADGQELRDRPHRRQGRVRAEEAAGRPCRAAGGGAPAVHRADARHARPDRQHRGRRDAPAGGRMGARPRSRRLPGGRRRQGHRPPVGHRQRGQRRVRPLAGRRLRVGRLGRLRPQGARHHRQGRVGERQAPLRRAGAAT